MDWQKVVGGNVRSVRKRCGLSQEQLALRADLDLRYLGGIERGEFNPTVSVLGKLAAVLDVAPGSLFDVDTAPSSEEQQTTPPES